MGKRPQKLLDAVREAIRVKHFSRRTEKTYVCWIRRYILFHNKRHPREMRVPEIGAFLTHPAINEKVAASTQNQALSALLFLYREFVRKELAGPIDAVRAKRSKRLPTVLKKEEVRKVIGFLRGTHKLIGTSLFWGCSAVSIGTS